jgi:hypothetical protein
VTPPSTGARLAEQLRYAAARIDELTAHLGPTGMPVTDALGALGAGLARAAHHAQALTTHGGDQ